MDREENVPHMDEHGSEALFGNIVHPNHQVSLHRGPPSLELDKRPNENERTMGEPKKRDKLQGAAERDIAQSESRYRIKTSKNFRCKNDEQVVFFSGQSIAQTKR